MGLLCLSVLVLPSSIPILLQLSLQRVSSQCVRLFPQLLTLQEGFKEV